MKCELEISSAYCGENTSVNGTIEVKGKTHKIEVNGTASDRGATANIDGVEHWWCGSTEELEKAVEKAVEKAFEDCENQVDEHGDVESNWTATYVNGTVTNVKFEENDED